MTMQLSADPVRFAIGFLRGAGFTAYDTSIEDDDLPTDAPYAQIKMAGGEPNADYLPRGIWTVDILTYAPLLPDARRYAMRIYDALQMAEPQEIATAGRLLAATCSTQNLEVYDDAQQERYFVQSWDLELAKIAGLD